MELQCFVVQEHECHFLLSPSTSQTLIKAIEFSPSVYRLPEKLKDCGAFLFEEAHVILRAVLTGQDAAVLYQHLLAIRATDGRGYWTSDENPSSWLKSSQTYAGK